ncbi:MAG: amino acid ABC transporter permease [Lachnospiraceae bacterium]|nr:amino acid ABC transporter permease [Lachnospiraceae bacterium]MDN4742759.1 amino acid ABC transporter permease [Lachnospiraceae bacterium C1.1]
MLENLKSQFILNFVEDNRWSYLLNGLGVTLKITFFAALLGLLIGFIIAMIRGAYQGTGKYKIPNAICNLYLTVIRGTPVVVQLMIIYFVIFGSVRIDKSLVAILAFGINSGAYQAEIFRSGIQAIPKGQYEAGRSLGFSYKETMLTVIMPQAIRNVIPTLLNEFIALLKETSVAGYIALEDLTKGGDIIRSRTYSAFMPLIAVAVIYLLMVLLMEQLVKFIERRLNKNGRK